MTKAIFLLLTFAFSCATFSQTAYDAIKTDIKKSASNYYAYPWRENAKPSELPSQTKAPKGYTPIYLSSYARHGSRWLIGKSEYAEPLGVLEKAKKNNKLTPRGLQLYYIIDSINKASAGRLGELTPLGVSQHRGIAKRMYKNFPEIFRKKAFIDAKSTIVIRCILSMLNACAELTSLNPLLEIKSDASQADMYYMNNENQPAITKYRKSSIFDSIYSARYHQQVKPETLMNKLFNDQCYVNDSIKVHHFYKQLFGIVANMQSITNHVDLFSLYGVDECYKLWECYNFSWYQNYAASPYNNGKLPYLQYNLLNEIIASADAYLKQNQPAASLRFGHEVVLLPLASLMELGNCGNSYSTPDDLAKSWRNYEIFPMAGNIQLIFYKHKKNKDILVKALLNEVEQTLPIKTFNPPYYRWDDLRNYYLNKLAAFKQKAP